MRTSSYCRQVHRGRVGRVPCDAARLGCPAFQGRAPAQLDLAFGMARLGGRGLAPAGSSIWTCQDATTDAETGTVQQYAVRLAMSHGQRFPVCRSGRSKKTAGHSSKSWEYRHIPGPDPGTSLQVGRSSSLRCQLFRPCQIGQGGIAVRVSVAMPSVMPRPGAAARVHCRRSAVRAPDPLPLGFSQPLGTLISQARVGKRSTAWPCRCCQSSARSTGHIRPFALGR